MSGGVRSSAAMSSDSPSAWGAPSPSGPSPPHAARPQLSSPSAGGGGGGASSAAAAAAAASPFLSAFRGLDLHGKVASEYVVRTKQGALVSLGALALAVALFIAELRFFLQTEVEETLEVDAARGQVREEGEGGRERRRFAAGRGGAARLRARRWASRGCSARCRAAAPLSRAILTLARSPLRVYPPVPSACASPST